MRKLSFLKKKFLKNKGSLPSFLLGFLGCAGCMVFLAIGLFLIFALIGQKDSSPATPASPGTWGTEGGDLANPNTLTAIQADDFFKKNNSPLAESGDGLIAAAQRFYVNPIFMIGISGAESSLGKYGRALANKNPGNVKKRTDGYENYGIKVIDYDDQNHAIFETWEDGWMGLALVLRTTYFDQGRNTLEEIAEKYLEGNKENWIRNVQKWMREVEDFISS